MTDSTNNFVTYIAKQLVTNEYHDNIVDILRGWNAGKLNSMEILAFFIIVYNITYKMIREDDSDLADKELKIYIVAARCSNLTFQFIIYVSTIQDIELTRDEVSYVLRIAHDIMKVLLISSPRYADSTMSEAWKLVIGKYITLAADHKLKSLTYKFSILFELFDLLTVKCGAIPINFHIGEEIIMSRLKAILNKPYELLMNKITEC